MSYGKLGSGDSAMYINFTKPLAEDFRAAYKQALANDRGTFIFQDKVILTSYAKYVCEYLVLQGLLDKEDA